MRQFHVYILASTRRRLYIGVTSDLYRRVWEHRHGVRASFTSRYRIDKLVYYETCANSAAAIEREKALKCWRRERKERLVMRENAGWLDLAASWYGEGPASIVDPGCSKTGDARS